jgi:hypothetical protein
MPSCIRPCGTGIGVSRALMKSALLRLLNLVAVETLVNVRV